MARAGGSLRLRSMPHVFSPYRIAEAKGWHIREFTAMNLRSKTHLKNREENESVCYWTPDSRTGIYVPRGHESVMDDVPKGAASLEQTYWLRNVEGVDKPESCYEFHI